MAGFNPSLAGFPGPPCVAVGACRDYPPMASPSSNEVIVIVDDEDFVRDVFGKTLRTLGYTVLVAKDGEHALQVMQDHHAPVHLVISDIQMPEMDGLEFVGLLRSAYPDMPALLVSGAGPQYMMDHRDRIPEGVHFLAKPVAIGELASKVRQILDKALETNG
jgi:two-component system cell cycle sensor histidine kinase/response regulator CckA